MKIEDIHGIRVMLFSDKPKKTNGSTIMEDFKNVEDAIYLLAKLKKTGKI